MSAKETMVERKVTYTLEKEGEFVIVENVPARVCAETGEQFFSMKTVERLQQMIWEGESPRKVIETRFMNLPRKSSRAGEQLPQPDASTASSSSLIYSFPR